MKQDSVLKLDLSFGPKQEGFLTTDKFPFPYKDNTFTLVKAGHVVEHINPTDKGFIKWMDEAWRILKFDGQLLISTYYAGSAGYWSDPTNVNGCTSQTWYYFDPLHATGFYKAYKPLPWRIDRCFAQPDGIMEVLLIKRRPDASYLK